MLKNFSKLLDKHSFFFLNIDKSVNFGSTIIQHLFLIIDSIKVDHLLSVGN